MVEDGMKYFKIAKELNEECEKDLKTKKLHFRGSIGSFSLISLDRATPEQGKGDFTNKDQGRSFLKNGIVSLLESKKATIKPGREKELQAWIINYAINNNHQLPFSQNLTFLTSELAFQKCGKKVVNDILAIDADGSLVVIELKDKRLQTKLKKQVNEFKQVIFENQQFFQELTVLLDKGAWNGNVRKMVVWPDANGRSRNDWKYDDDVIEEIRYKEEIGSDGPKIYYNEKDEIIFLQSEQLVTK